MSSPSPAATSTRVFAIDPSHSEVPTAAAPEWTSPEHDNLRGPDYYLPSTTTH